METARKALETMKRGTVTVMWDRVVARIGDRYLVGTTIRIHDKGVTLEEAAKVLCERQD